ncbi:hypothetical protein BLNAU_17379 [Blattamonas nauphoetae]|uniref:Uncharacterized protein n=1 Tax=Blattamonas nauphoetae TaxID=2049346 RepID=A0ABQ9XA23_9EUKA|nr:hypothetical protein BLNAU_17379 [Blattamonas nauphoetae]
MHARRLLAVVNFHTSIVFYLPRPPQNPISRIYRSFVPSASTDSSSELVPFAGRLCSTLAELVSEMKSLFTESSPSDGTISALSATLPDEAPLLSENAVLEVLYEELSLVNSLLSDMDNNFEDILIKCDFVPLLKSTIITCLDLLEQQKSESDCQPSDRTHMLVNILNWSWDCASESICDSLESLCPVVESTFSDVQELCSLLVRTCCHFSSTNFSHLDMIINIGAYTPHLIPRLLEGNLVERVIETSKPMAVQTTHGSFHLDLIWVIVNLIWDPRFSIQNKEEQKRIRILQFERLLKPAKQYLQFILQREEFIPKDDTSDEDLPSIITDLLERTQLLERALFEDGEIVETGREEWEVGWLVEKTNENYLGERLEMIRLDDVRMKKRENARWKKRVERHREAGHEDAMEGWLMRRDEDTRSEIVEYIECVSAESGMNNGM